MRTLTTAALILMAAGSVMASEGDDLTSLSYISYLERYATVQPASDDDTIEAIINMPVVVGDRVDTAREARMEVVLADGSILWLDQYTTVSLDAVAFSRDVGGDRTVLFLVDGTVLVQVPEHVLGAEPLRLDSSSATVYLTEPGLYRLEKLRSGGLRVEVWEGLAEAATTAGGILVEPSTAAEVSSGQVAGVEPHLTWGDDFARWVEQRRQIYAGESSEHVDPRFAREAAALDSYGAWVYVDATSSWAWQPSVGPDWRPFSAGRWHWTPTGWSWISFEPWGWLPSHYGSWFIAPGFGWVWSWGPVWSPAWVTWSWWPGWVGWAPHGCISFWAWGRHPGWWWGPQPLPPGPGSPRPPRGNVVPPRGAAPPGDGTTRRHVPDARVRADAGDSGAARRVTPGAGGTIPAADFTGRVRVSEMDPEGWNVVATEDFASDHLSRLVRPGDRVLPEQGDATGVVVTGPLTTRAPSAARVSDELSRTFSGVAARTGRDITRVMARDPSLDESEMARLVQPSTLGELSRSSAQSMVASRPGSEPRSTAAGTAAGAGSRQPVLSAGPGSPFSRSATAGLDRRDQPNLYLPGRSSSDGSSSARTPVETRVSPLIRRSGRPTTTTPSGAPPSVAAPSTPRSTSSPFVRQPVSPRVGGGPSSLSRGSSRPVIVPRTSPSRPSRSLATGSPYVRSPSSIRGAPTGRSSVSAPSSRAPSRATGSSGVRSSGSVRSSPSPSSPPSSSASSSGSSSGSRRQ